MAKPRWLPAIPLMPILKAASGVGVSVKNIKNIAKSSLHSFSAAASRRIIKQFASKYQFVYFGRVDPREDEYELVRGLTVSTTHIDNHYTVGTFNGHDIILLERRNTLTFPGKADVTYRWLIMQIDLKTASLPHVFIDSHHHDAMFYANAFIAKQGMQDLSNYFSAVSPTFTQRCKLFANPTTYQQVGAVITPEIAETLAQHFNQFDYEFFDDRIIVYATSRVPTPQMLDDMLRVGAWLAEQYNAL